MEFDEFPPPTAQCHSTIRPRFTPKERFTGFRPNHLKSYRTEEERVLNTLLTIMQIVVNRAPPITYLRTKWVECPKGAYSNLYIRPHLRTKNDFYLPVRCFIMDEWAATQEKIYREHHEKCFKEVFDELFRRQYICNRCYMRPAMHEGFENLPMVQEASFNHLRHIYLHTTRGLYQAPYAPLSSMRSGILRHQRTSDREAYFSPAQISAFCWTCYLFSFLRKILFLNSISMVHNRRHYLFLHSDWIELIPILSDIRHWCINKAPKRHRWYMINNSTRQLVTLNRIQVSSSTPIHSRGPLLLYVFWAIRILKKIRNNIQLERVDPDLYGPKYTSKKPIPGRINQVGARDERLDYHDFPDEFDTDTDDALSTLNDTSVYDPILPKVMSMTFPKQDLTFSSLLNYLLRPDGTWKTQKSQISILSVVPGDPLFYYFDRQCHLKDLSGLFYNSQILQLPCPLRANIPLSFPLQFSLQSFIPRVIKGPLESHPNFQWWFYAQEHLQKGQGAWVQFRRDLEETPDIHEEENWRMRVNARYFNLSLFFIPGRYHSLWRREEPYIRAHVVSSNVDNCFTLRVHLWSSDLNQPIIIVFKDIPWNPLYPLGIADKWNSFQGRALLSNIFIPTHEIRYNGHLSTRERLLQFAHIHYMIRQRLPNLDMVDFHYPSYLKIGY